MTLTKWRRIWGERFTRNTLEVVEVSQADQRAALDEDRVDLCFVRLPLDRDGVHVIPLWEETPVVLARKDHPISVFDAVTTADLADEMIIADDHPDAVDLVAGGAGVLLVPQAVAREYSRRDLVHRPISDAAPTSIGLAWLVDHPSDLIDDFVGVVRGRTVNSTRSRSPEPRAPAKTGRTEKPARPVKSRTGSPARRPRPKRH